MRPLRYFLTLPALLLAVAAQAQTTPLLLTPQPLAADPGRATTAVTITGAAQRTAALTLPLF